MRCKNCGAELTAKNGLYVCENCGSTSEVSLGYENSDVYIAYIESDEQGRRTKDSIVGQEIYNKLENANIRTYFQRISASSTSGDEYELSARVALDSAKIIIILGTTSQHFERLLENYRNCFEQKTLIPIYTDMNAYDIPSELNGLQALNYSSVGAVSDLAKNILNMLGRTSELNIIDEADKIFKKRKKIISLSLISTFTVILVVCLYVVFGTTYILPSKKYNKAEQMISKLQYADAIVLLSQIDSYKNSNDMLRNVYGQYVGYYQSKDENVSLHVNVSKGLRADVEITETLSDGTVVKIIESAQIDGNIISINFNDSQNNQGHLIIELKNDGIDLNKKLDNSKNALHAFFTLADKSDQPILKKLNADVLLKWLEQKISMSQIEAQGYEVVEYSLMERDGLNRLYTIKNTDVVLAMFGLDISKPYDGYENMQELNDKLLFGCIAPAIDVIPDYVGKAYEPFVKNGVLYWPGAQLGESGGERNLLIDVYEDNGETTILEETPIAFATKNALREFNWESLLMNVLKMNVEKEAKNKYGLNKDAWCYAQYLAENDTHQLYSIGTEPLNERMSYALFKINKNNQQVEFITEAPKTMSDWGGLEEVDWKLLYPELRTEFPQNRYDY